MNSDHRQADRQVQGQFVSHLPPGPWPVSLLRAATVRQLLDDVTDSETAATWRQVLLLHLQPAQRPHRKTLTDRQVGRQTGGEIDR